MFRPIWRMRFFSSVWDGVAEISILSLFANILNTLILNTLPPHLFFKINNNQIASLLLILDLYLAAFNIPLISPRISARSSISKA